MDGVVLVLETSGRQGQLALAQGEEILRANTLDAGRRHARDLAPALSAILEGLGLRPRQLSGIIVSRGPGSYTGLRVGLMTAKALAYALGCPLIAVDTFAAIVRALPEEARQASVLADAPQDKVYLQDFERGPAGWRPLADLAILPFTTWLGRHDPMAWITGPALELHAGRLPANALIPPPDRWLPRLECVWRQGMELWHQGLLADPWTLEPLYARPSSAEELADRG